MWSTRPEVINRKFIKSSKIQKLKISGNAKFSIVILYLYSYNVCLCVYGVDIHIRINIYLVRSASFNVT